MLWVHWAVRSPFSKHSDSMRKTLDPLSFLPSNISTGLRSTHLFWYYSEAAIGLFTACLPSLSGFTKIEGFTSTLSTVRSRLSVSFSSRRSSSASDAQAIIEPCTPLEEFWEEDKV